MKNKNTFIQTDHPSLLNKEKEIAKKIDTFLDALNRTYPSSKELAARSFLHGLFVALGSTLGLAIFLAVFSFVLNQFRFLPFVDNIFTFLNLR